MIILKSLFSLAALLIVSAQVPPIEDQHFFSPSHYRTTATAEVKNNNFT
jgi:hypothetical protein